jgi:hypothetical protein
VKIARACSTGGRPVTGIRITADAPSSKRLQYQEVVVKSQVTIRFVSGREEQFEIELWGGTGAETRLQQFAENPSLLLQTAEEVLIIPGAAIECISIKLPPGDSRFKLKDLRPAKRIK